MKKQNEFRTRSLNGFVQRIGETNQDFKARATAKYKMVNDKGTMRLIRLRR